MDKNTAGDSVRVIVKDSPKLQRRSNETIKEGNMTEKTISQHNAGKCRARYNRLSTALKSAGHTTEDIQARIARAKDDDCITFDVSLDTLNAAIASLNAHSATGAGKVAMRKLHFGIVRDTAHHALRFDNTIIATDWTKVNAKDMREFLMQAQSAKRELADNLNTTEWTTNNHKGYCCMIFSPNYNPNTHEDINPNRYLYLMVGDWDPDRSYHKYGCRMVPGGEATWFYSISFDEPKPVTVTLETASEAVVTDTVTPADTVTPKPKRKPKPKES